MGPQSATTSTKTIAAAVTTNLREFLAFNLGAEDYGIDILRVQKIRSHEEPTRIAKRSPCPEGGLR
jgi:purine-binding chemotaxis protein CheW